jgi:hypothetical protein
MENHSILAGGDTIIPLYYTSKIGMIATITGGIFILILLSPKDADPSQSPKVEKY